MLYLPDMNTKIIGIVSKDELEEARTYVYNSKPPLNYKIHMNTANKYKDVIKLDA